LLFVPSLALPCLAYDVHDVRSCHSTHCPGDSRRREGSETKKNGGGWQSTSIETTTKNKKNKKKKKTNSNAKGKKTIG
jgi:hypothetical protein